MDPIGTIAEIFATHIEEVSAAAVTAPDSINEACEVMVHALLSDKKILSAGSGNCAVLAQLFATHLLHHFQRERPGLPAIALSADSCMVNTISEDTQYADAIARQVSTLGQPGDILLLIAGSGRGDSLVRALSAARERDMTVILCHGSNHTSAASLLDTHDVEISLPIGQPARLLEAQLVLIHCVCELIDIYLFGGEH
jgi:D-sedoheptulose 7-phosphate isomerase